jgi:hypothetical protein
MWCVIDKSNFPIIKISFNAEKQVEEEFDLFLNEWLKLYEEEKEFYFVFDTCQLGMMNVKYAYKMSKFIKELKKRENQYLKKSLIIVKNKYISFLLNIVFSITKPVANVYLFSEHTDKLIKEDIENISTPNGFETTIKDYEINLTIIKSN